MIFIQHFYIYYFVCELLRILALHYLVSIHVST